MSYPYIIQGTNITIVIDNIPYSINETHMGYKDVKDAIKSGDWEKIKSLVCVKKLIADFSKGNVSVYGETLFWKNKEMHGAIVERFIQMHKEGFSIDPLVAFMDNLMLNPSEIAIKELYDFMEVGQLPITSDGCFLAYKRISKDYKDCHSGTVVNKPSALMSEEERQFFANNKSEQKVQVSLEEGLTVVSMNRLDVDGNRNNYCSTGLHFCSLDYLKSFNGDRTIILKINPKDVVSIPSDYQFTKGRCCSYVIVGEIPNTMQHESFSSPVQENANNVFPESSNPVETFEDEYSDVIVWIEDESPVADVADVAATKPQKMLSMTPNAIRKREKRAQDRLLKNGG